MSSNQSSLEFTNHLTNALRNLCESSITIVPEANRLPIRRKGAISLNIKPAPFCGPQKDRNHTRGPSVMLFKGPGHFPFDTLVRVKEIGTEEQDNDISLANIGFNDFSVIATCGDIVIIVDINETLLFLATQVCT